MLGDGKDFSISCLLYWYLFQRGGFNQGSVTDRVKSVAWSVNNTELVSHKGMPSAKSSGRQFRGKNWDEAIIITKERVSISWELIQEVLGNSVKRLVELFPFLANKAVWWPSNKSEHYYFLKLKREFFEKRVTLVFDLWSPESNKSDMVYECCNSWIRIFNLPWNLCSYETFKSIVEGCGDLLEISEDTFQFRDLRAAKIRVRGLEGGFIKSGM